MNEHDDDELEQDVDLKKIMEGVFYSMPDVSAIIVLRDSGIEASVASNAPDISKNAVLCLLLMFTSENKRFGAITNMAMTALDEIIKDEKQLNSLPDNIKGMINIFKGGGRWHT